MGEKSKTVGEIGENIVENFFQLLGWSDAIQNISIPCLKSQKHALANSKTGKRETHGIDYLVSYKSSLEANQLENVIISVKHTSKPYPTNPRKLFEEYSQELTKTIECFKNSSTRTDQQKKFQRIRSARDTGVLFWLSSYDKAIDDDLTSKLTNVQIDWEANFESFHLVDNRQINFIYKTITSLKNIFINEEILFYYPETGLSYEDPSIRRHGNIFPVEFITSPLIPFYIKHNNSNSDTICIASNDNFDEDSSRRIAKAALEYTSESTVNYLFLYPDYSSTHHFEAFKRSIVGLSKQISERAEIRSFNQDFRGLDL